MLPPDWTRCLAPNASRADRAAVRRLSAPVEDGAASPLPFWSRGDVEHVLRFLPACPQLTYVFWWIEPGTPRFVRCSSDLDAVRELLTTILGPNPLLPPAAVPRRSVRGMSAAESFDLMDRFVADVVERDDLRPLVAWRIKGEPAVYVDGHITWNPAEARQHLAWLLHSTLDSPVPRADDEALGIAMAARAEEHLTLPRLPSPLWYRTDWRLRRVMWLLERRRRPRRGLDDMATGRAHQLLTSGRRRRPNPDAAPLLAARDIAEGALLRKSVLEAWLLMGQSNEEIAVAIGENPDTVGWFEKCTSQCGIDWNPATCCKSSPSAGSNPVIRPRSRSPPF